MSKLKTIVVCTKER